MPPPPVTAPSTVAEWSTPQPVNRPPSPLPVLLLPLKYVLGFIFTTCLISVLVPIAPFLLLYRLGKYIHDKLVLPRSCDVLWPRPPFTRAFLWLNRQVSLESIKAILNGQPPPVQKLCFVPSPISAVEVEPWDQQKHPLHTHADLVTYVKQKIDHVPYAVTVKVATGYENNSLGRTLLAITTHPDSFPLCMARIVSALSQGNVTIEVEPRVYYECRIDPELRFQGIRRFADVVGKFLEAYSIGPFFLMFLPHWKPEKVWRALMATSDQVTTYRRRWSLGGEVADSETSALTIATSVQLKPETDASFSITEITGIDELQKVERLMRATMAELLVSFLAGALRKYFRESDPAVVHPPDCDAAFAVCSHKSSMCDECSPCDHLMMPIALPIGVEGMIPRLWSLQKQFANHNEICTPEALRVFNAITHVLLPRETANRVANIFFNHAIINVSFLRIHGDVMLDSNVLTRFIPIPPLSLPSRASFVFVQQREKILLVSSIDRGLFDRHTDIFKHMQDEQRGLMDHLSFRLRSLSQTCVLPDRLPSEDAAPPGPAYPVPPEAPNNSPSAERDELLPGPSRARRQSVADLNELLMEVQQELDEMRKNPSVDNRDGTIQRLKELEAKIESFHLGMKSELWGHMDPRAKDEAMMSVAELLAPYKRRVSVGDRKLSRRVSIEHAGLRRLSAHSVVFERRRGSDQKKEEKSGEEKRSEEERRCSQEDETAFGEEKGEEEKKEEGGKEEEKEVKKEEMEEQK